MRFPIKVEINEGGAKECTDCCLCLITPPGNGCGDKATAELNANVLIREQMVFILGNHALICIRQAKYAARKNTDSKKEPFETDFSQPYVPSFVCRPLMHLSSKKSTDGSVFINRDESSY